MNVTMTGGKRKVSSLHFLPTLAKIIFRTLCWGMGSVRHARRDIGGGSEAERCVGDEIMSDGRIERADDFAADEPQSNYLVVPVIGG